jgi:NAD(P)-dependent dehydrogenase (short-subunit alcohol dehydrogenase family)
MNVMKMFDLSGQVAAITGAGNGLGFEFAEAMAEAGANVVCGDIDMKGNERTVARVTELGRKAITVRCDVTNEADVAALFAGAEKARMPKAATTAAQIAMKDAGIPIGDIRFVGTHNPFAVNDPWFSRQAGFPVERMNLYGSSLIYGHPQGPTGLRGIAELVHALVEAGGGIDIFTGCAAGDTGAALVLRVD